MTAPRGCVFDGSALELGAIRHLLDLESIVTYAETESVHELSVGCALTGFAAF